MFIREFHIDSLGNLSYLIGSEEARVCAVVDPVRDVDIYVAEAEKRGCRILYSLETHVHNDYISGSRELAARLGTAICAPSAGGYVFQHRPLRAGDAITLGEVRLEVIATPGHTPEHISYLAADTSRGNGPHALFSGGALMVGGVARSDLMGRDVAPFLGRWFHQTMRRELQHLDDLVAVLPTHGGGSFCMATPVASGTRTTTIGQERATNPFFSAASEQEFLELASSNLPSTPAYYKRMAAINVRGPRILGGLPVLYPLGPREVWTRMQRGATAIDARHPAEYAGGHIPKAYHIPFTSSFGTWVGWLVDENASLVLVSDDAQAREQMVRHLIRIGYEALEGYLEGGMEAWKKARLPLATLNTVTAHELYAALDSGRDIVPVDVRFNHEWHEGHVPGAVHIELGDLPGRLASLSRDRTFATVCAAGFRASTAASMLERQGVSSIMLLVGGTDAWRDAGLPLERGEERHKP